MEPPKPKSTVLQKLSRLKVKPNVKVPTRTASQTVETSATTPDLPLSSDKTPDCNESGQKNSVGEVPSTSNESSEQSKTEFPKVSDNDSGEQNLNPSELISEDKKVDEIQSKQKEEPSAVGELKEQNHGLSCSSFKPRSVSKIRPNIERASHRIRTYSSASESEDEGKRLQLRTQHPSVKKPNVNVPIKPVNQAEVEIVSTKQENKPKKKYEEKSQLEIRKEDMRKKFAKGQVDLSKMTMFDLIYYNPDGEKPTRSKEKIVTRRRMLESESNKKVKDTETNYILEERIAEEEEERRLIEENMASENDKEGEGKENVEEVDDEDTAMPVPQVRLGPNGEIVLDEQSLVIETSETKKRKNELANTPVIIENSAGLVNYGSWRKRKRSSKWSIRETARFYRALSMLGTDFSLMESLFPRRTRFELKRKFKMEEKTNRALIDKTIGTQKPFDASLFGDESDDSDAESTASQSQKKPKARDSESVEQTEDSDLQPRKKKRKKKVVFAESEDEVRDEEEAIPTRLEIEAEEIVLSSNVHTVSDSREESNATLTSLLQLPLG